MEFCTAINCMDGRVQLPVIQYLKKRFNVKYVDSITEPGPNLILAKQKNFSLIKSIFDCISISVDRHNSVGIAIVGHHDCAGNSASQEQQFIHIAEAMQVIKRRYSGVEIIGLWVDKEWVVTEISEYIDPIVA